MVIRLFSLISLLSLFDAVLDELELVHDALAERERLRLILQYVIIKDTFDECIDELY